LPVATGAAALGVPVPRDADWQALLGALRDDPLHRPGATASGARIVRGIGGFAGNRGRFLRPPRVRTEDGHVVASDGHKAYRVYVDAFGSAWVPLAVDAAGPMPENPGLSPQLAGLEAAVSVAAVGRLLAVTVRDSLKIRLVARG
jgi:hypothetical protein